MQKCASLNHGKKMKAEPIRMIPRKLTANLTLLMAFVSLQYKIYKSFCLVTRIVSLLVMI